MERPWNECHIAGGPRFIVGRSCHKGSGSGDTIERHAERRQISDAIDKIRTLVENVFGCAPKSCNCACQWRICRKGYIVEQCAEVRDCVVARVFCRQRIDARERGGVD